MAATRPTTIFHLAAQADVRKALDDPGYDADVNIIGTINVLEAARGVGMGPTRVLLTIQLPIAWPVILTGVRVAAQLTVGIAAIAAYVAGPGLGEYIFKGLSSLGSKNALNYALTGTVVVIILALVLDGIFVLISRYITSRGLPA